MKRLFLIIMLLSVPAFGADVVLEWDLPTTNTDGSALTDLAGCRVYKNGVMEFDTNDPTVTTHTVTGITESDILTARCYDTAGNESIDSNSVTIGISPNAPVLNCQAISCINCTINTCQ